MTKQQAIEHNNRVVTDVIETLFAFKMVDTMKMFTNPNYAKRSVVNYINAANLARETMGMPKIVLYAINDFDEE
jgi:hypothetical protein